MSNSATLWTVARQAPLSMGILQARVLEWVAIPFSSGSSRPRDRTLVSCIDVLKNTELQWWQTDRWLAGFRDKRGQPHSSVSEESACNAGDLGSMPGLGRSPEEGNSNPLQYSCLRNPMDRGAWWATVHGVARVGHGLATKPPPGIRVGVARRSFGDDGNVLYPDCGNSYMNLHIKIHTLCTKRKLILLYVN